MKCLRCGNFGHQSGDRDCPMKDVIMPNEESRLKRDDPLTAIMAQMDPTEVVITSFLVLLKLLKGVKALLLQILHLSEIWELSLSLQPLFLPG